MNSPDLNSPNLADQQFWDSKYLKLKRRYFLRDPLYGKNGLFARTLNPWLGGVENVLELGCGSSRFLMYFKIVAGLDTYGLDFSPEGLQGLREMAKAHNVEHSLYSGDMFELDLEDEKFDLVFHAGLVEHFTDPDRVFLRCRFFTKPGGLMIFIIPNMQNRAWGWHEKICPKNFQAHIPYTPDEMTTAMLKYFETLKSKPWGYPQVYAGGPPETMAASALKYLNLGLIFGISLISPKYRGSNNPKLAGSRLFVCRAI